MKYLSLLVIILLLLNCGPTKSSVSKEHSIDELRQLVEKRRYEIVSNNAMPQASSSLMQIQNSGILGVGNTAGSINLIGNPNYLKIIGDSVRAELPYFGEQRMGGTYGERDQGITLNAHLSNYSTEWNAKKKRYIIRFNAEGKNDEYQVFINLFPNLTSTMSITGNGRTPIQYTGVVSKMNEEK